MGLGDAAVFKVGHYHLEMVRFFTAGGGGSRAKCNGECSDGLGGRVGHV